MPMNDKREPSFHSYATILISGNENKSSLMQNFKYPISDGNYVLTHHAIHIYSARRDVHQINNINDS